MRRTDMPSKVRKPKTAIRRKTKPARRAIRRTAVRARPQPPDSARDPRSGNHIAA